ncbi:MAG: 16S rRNA (cytosine(1402)-N(4))-methyltransferase RsmH [Oscillospiraceae bacterium]
MSENFEHLPVLLKECIDGLEIKPDGIYLDGTAGGAGHSSEIASRLTNGKLFALDKDPDAVAAAGERLKRFPCARVIEGDFSNARELLPDSAQELDGALLDLGVSSHQLDCAERGFSYSHEGALDMRMSQSGASAADLVNGALWQELADIIRTYGEEPNASLIAKKIDAARRMKPIETTTELSAIIVSALPPAVRRKDKNPARRTFQALRIAVNDEMGALSRGLDEIFTLLRPGGRLCVITFHSLEDRVVKKFFAEMCRGCTCPPDFPICVCGNTPRGELVTRKPISATEAECEINRRSRSAKLRVIEKL